MAFIKKIIANPLVKKFLSAKALKIILVILLAVGLFILIYKAWKKRRAKKLQEAEGQPEEKKLAPSALLKLWKNFLRQIPREFRYSISHYHPAIVIGEAGSGKTQIIDNYTDWQGQACQFYPSYKTEPDLQIYLGSQVVVQEIPAPLLNDTSTEARKALLKLWKVFLRKRDPIVIVPLNAASLAGVTPQTMKRQAQMMRGKLNLISSIRKKPVKVRIVLTHMDQLPGYAQFSAFLEEQKIPLQITLGENPAESDLRECLEPYEQYLPLALTTLPASKYKECLKFLIQAPETFGSFSIFLQTLTEYAPLSYDIKLENLYLTSDAVESDIITPFATGWSDEVMPAYRRRLRFHQAACIAIALLGTIYMGAAYVREEGTWRTSYRSMQNYRLNPSPELEKEARNSIITIAQDQGAGVDRFLPSFFQHSLKTRLTAAIRDFYILPQLKQAQTAKVSQEKPLYILSLLYASKRNELGRLIQKRIAEWEENLNISRQIIKVYMDNSDYAWNDYSVSLETSPFEETSTPTKDFRPWNRLLRKMRYAYEQPVIRPSYLQELREDIQPLKGAIDEVQSYYSAKEIFVLLQQEAPKLKLGRIYNMVMEELEVAGWINANSRELESFLGMIGQTQVANLPAVKNMTLRDLIDELKINHQTVPPNSKVYQFSVQDEQFSFAAQKWMDMVRNSRTILLLRKFAAYHKQRPSSRIFFRRYSHYPDVVMNPYNDGNFQFTGKVRVKGPYTQTAYQNEIKPVLEQLGALLSHDFDKHPEALPIHPKVKDYFANFIFQEVEKYAAAYKKAWNLYYEKFGVKAESLGSLKDILTLMQLPVSPFQEFLQNINKNTAFEKSSSPFLPPLYESLKDFQYVNRLLVEDKKSFPELEKYKAIVRQIISELRGEAPTEKKPQKEQEEEDYKLNGMDEFDRRLSPLGRLSLNIFLNRQDSYLTLVKSWLNSVGIIGKRQKPFVAPIHELYRLGVKDIEKTLAKNWDQEVMPVIEPILNQFPLRVNGFTDVSPSKLEEVLHPTAGLFHKNFKNLIQPVCIQHNGQWQLRDSFQERMSVPEGMFAVSNRLFKITKLLWDKNGDPLKLCWRIQTHTLPRSRIKNEQDRPIVLAYLKSGPAAIFSFNQRPAWYNFEVEWWRPHVAVIGIQFDGPEAENKYFEEIFIPESLWSLFKILKKGQPLEKNVWAWEVPEGSNLAKKIRFTIEAGTWQILFPIKNEAGD